MLLVLFLFAFFFILLPLIFHLKYPEIRWNWEKINLKTIQFPKSFIWGTATASHQVEGNCINNWSQFEGGNKTTGEPNIKDSQVSGNACEHWDRYPKDIELIKNIGVRYYRFSLEWSKIEPQKGMYNQDAINHYSDLINKLISKGVTPVITLHHFTHPIWFENIGAFEKEENIQHLLLFAEKVFNEYSDRVKYWCTINEPAVVATQGYFTGMFPPGKKNIKLTCIVLKNLLEAHVQIYKKIKSMKNGDAAQVGIVKNINHFDPWRRYSVSDWLLTLFMNYAYNTSSIRFFKTGKFKILIPGFLWISHKNMNACTANDFFGLNYYSHNHIKFNIFNKDFFELKFHSKDTMTDMPYTIYAEGIYRAIQEVSKLSIPIIITENGVADKDDKIRAEYIQKYLYATMKSIEDGYNVIGYFYWSLLDNFEWAFGYDMKFGLYSVDFKNQIRKLREGSETFVQIIKKNESKI